MKDDGLKELATQYSIPPPILYGLHVMVEDKSDESVAYLARVLAGAFRKERTWEGAISYALTGDAGVVNNPSHPDGGTVNAVLGIAAARPDWGMQGYRPVDLQVYAGAVKAMERTAKNLARLGGVVTPDHVNRWGQSISRVRNPPPPSGQAQPQFNARARDIGPPPDIHHAKAVAEFAHVLKSSGIPVEQFKSLYPVVGSTYRRLLARSPSVEEFVRHAEQTPDQVLQSVRAMPAPGHPDVTAGQMNDAWHMASIHAVGYVERMPQLHELKGFILGGMNHTAVRDFYKTLAQNPSGKIDVRQDEKDDAAQPAASRRKEGPEAESGGRESPKLNGEK